MLLSRFESLGDNCEFGFVHRQLSYEDGSLFRWARIDAWQLYAVLNSDFSRIYEFDNLVPYRDTMVREKYYNFGWHSRMYSRTVEGVQVFVDDAEVRKLVHASELRKCRYLIAKFLAKLRAGGMIYVIKGNSGIDPVCIDMIIRELLRLSEGAKFWLLEVRSVEEGKEVGSCESVSDTHLIGYVKRFADYNTADDFDLGVYEDILQKASALALYPTWNASVAQADQVLAGFRTNLPFPLKSDLGEGDFKTSFPTCEALILNSHLWSRKLETQFRLHALDETRAASKLMWQHIRKPGDWLVATSLSLSVPDSHLVDVRFVVTVNGEVVAEKLGKVTSTSPVPFSLAYSAAEGDDVTIAIEPNCLEPLGAGKAAVIDIDELTLEKQ